MKTSLILKILLGNTLKMEKQNFAFEKEKRKKIRLEITSRQNILHRLEHAYEQQKDEWRRVHCQMWSGILGHLWSCFLHTWSWLCFLKSFLSFPKNDIFRSEYQSYNNSKNGHKICFQRFSLKIRRKESVWNDSNETGFLEPMSDQSSVGNSPTSNSRLH